MRPALRWIAAGAAFATLTAWLPVAPADDPEPAYSRAGADTCLACHNDAGTRAVMHGRHGVAGDPRSPQAQFQCESCHGPQGRHPAGDSAIIAFGRDANTPVDQQNEACIACHAADTGAGWHGSSHALDDLSCADCHRSHVASDPVLSLTGQAGVCLDCHPRQRSQVFKPYGHPLRAGKMNCSSCHEAHDDSNEFALIRPTLNETCFECHAEKRGPFLFEHAPVVEDCSLCHLPHGSSHPALLARRPPLLCQQCHSQAGHPSLAFTDDGLAGASPSPMLLAGSCLNCHSQVHGSNHPSGITEMR